MTAVHICMTEMKVFTSNSKGLTLSQVAEFCGSASVIVSTSGTHALQSPLAACYIATDKIPTLTSLLSAPLRLALCLQSETDVDNTLSDSVSNSYDGIHTKNSNDKNRQTDSTTENNAPDLSSSVECAKLAVSVLDMRLSADEVVTLCTGPSGGKGGKGPAQCFIESKRISGLFSLLLLARVELCVGLFNPDHKS
jgi:hypothetical protein